MRENQANAPQKISRFSRIGGRHASGPGLHASSMAAFPQLSEQLEQAAAAMREMESNVGFPMPAEVPGWSPGMRVRHKRHPEYGTGRIRYLVSGGRSAFCSFDRFARSAEGWTPSGYYRLNQLVIVEDVDSQALSPL
ncbi:hypothetical protein [Paenibacillus chibensis]|uniref:hypothetical protein n=1 Tax=Paenibacillus chibensis TaxID=59846 RepID=UPI000FD80EF8|nr:hypothetical protein [Paenibacillus chibensis]MEC0369686.1 hypothetical protein [Paenibacillus chibensis]